MNENQKNQMLKQSFATEDALKAVTVIYEAVVKVRDTQLVKDPWSRITDDLEEVSDQLLTLIDEMGKVADRLQDLAY